MMRFTTLLLLTAMLAGCALPGGQTTPAGNGGTGNKPGTGGITLGGGLVANEPLEPLNGISFKPITEKNSKFLSDGGNIAAGGGGNLGPTAAKANAAAPTTAMAPGIAGTAAESTDAAPRPAANTAPSDAGTKMVGGGASSGNVNSYYGYGYYFGGYGGWNEQMALVSVQEAETVGAKGGFQDVITGVVAPVVKAWAADGRLVQSQAALANDGTIFVDPNAGQGGSTPGYPGNGIVTAVGTAQTAPASTPQPATAAIPQVDSAPRKLMSIVAMPVPGGMYDSDAGWRMTYISATRSEALTFTVTPAKTTIIRMRWAPLNLSPERVLVDSSKALKNLITAIEDKTFQSEEEKTGKDYFLGFPFLQQQNETYAKPTYPGGEEMSRTEVVYDVPDNARWNVSLQLIMGKLVWDLNYYSPDQGVGIATPARAAAPPDIAYPQDGGGAQVDKPEYVCPSPDKLEESMWFNNSAQGMIDAEKGTVIRFTRPTKQYNRYYNPQPCYFNVKSPLPSATPVPNPNVTATPTTSPKPTATPASQQ